RLHQNLHLTTIYVTHDQEEALSMADRLVVLREGRVQQVGTPEELHTSPVNWHVADFMGYRNLLDVTVDQAGPDGVVVSNQDLKIRGTQFGNVIANSGARLAIRAEDLRIVDDDSTQGGAIVAEVAVVEYHGREFSVGAMLPSGTTLYVRSDYAPSPGDRVQLVVAQQRALVFVANLDVTGAPAQGEALVGEATPLDPIALPVCGTGWLGAVSIVPFGCWRQQRCSPSRCSSIRFSTASVSQFSPPRECGRSGAAVCGRTTWRSS